MTQYFECKVRYEKTLENGLAKRVTEPYIVEALSFTEAEARLTEETAPFAGGGEYEISDIRKARLSDLVESQDGNDDRWFRAKVAFLSLDEKSGQEKRTTHTMLVKAQDLRVAVKNLDAYMAGSMADYLITGLAETQIMDVFHYRAEQ
ncbi:MAG: DUF4494 domain-containing protein [Prevotellaceae bacterium]|nr:DUF4494 domain-containing protein [Prevotellaceae bacterium]